MAGPLEPLKKQKVIDWTDTTRDCFRALQRAFKTAPFLAYPNFNRRFVIACDSSLSGAGGVLYQPIDDDDTITPYNILFIFGLIIIETKLPVFFIKNNLILSLGFSSL